MEVIHFIPTQFFDPPVAKRRLDPVDPNRPVSKLRRRLAHCQVLALILVPHVTEGRSGGNCLPLRLRIRTSCDRSDRLLRQYPSLITGHCPVRTKLSQR